MIPIPRSRLFEKGVAASDAKKKHTIPNVIQAKLPVPAKAQASAQNNRNRYAIAELADYAQSHAMHAVFVQETLAKVDIRNTDRTCLAVRLIRAEDSGDLAR